MLAQLLVVADLCTCSCVRVQPPDLSLARQQIEQSVTDLSFGEKQVEQFICDRPDTGEIIKREPALRMMLIWHFAGELKGSRAYLDCRDPPHSHPACHLQPVTGYPVLVQISNKCGTSAVDKCMMLLFELLNFDVDEEYQLLYDANEENRKSRDDFATSCIQCEFNAVKKTRIFFQLHPIAGATFKNAPNYWTTVLGTNDFSEYVRWLDTLDSKAYNPLKYYRNVYDSLLAYKR